MLVPKSHAHLQFDYGLEEINENNVKDILGKDDTGLFDPIAIMDSAIDPLTNTARDFRLDDREIPVAKNYFDFCKNIVGEGIHPPFARQMWMGYKLFGEHCCRCSDPKWENIRDVPVDAPLDSIQDHVTFLENGVCPKCKTNRNNLQKDGSIADYVSLVLGLGQRSGKSTSIASMSVYLTHRFLKAPQLSKIMMIQSFTPLTATFVGITAARAKRLLWDPVLAFIDNSQWFKDYHSLLDQTSAKIGTELSNRKGTFIRYAHKNIDLYYMGPDKTKLRGDTRIIGATDELSWFPNVVKKSKFGGDEEESEKGRANADETYTALENSLMTVRTGVMALRKKGVIHIPSAYNFSMSSPVSQRDIIMRLCRETKDSTNILSLNLPTWEVNPEYTRDHPYIAAKYKENPAKAERDWGANPPEFTSRFIGNEGIIDCFRGRQIAAIIPKRAEPTETEVGSGWGKLAVNVKKARPPAVLALDAGFKNNSFGGSLGYLDKETGSPIVPFVFEVMASEQYPIDFDKIYTDLILPICKEFNVCVLTADRWNSLSMLHRAKTDVKNIIAGQKSVKMPDFKLVRSLLNEGRLLLPQLEDDNVHSLDDMHHFYAGYPHSFMNKAVTHLYFQCLTVQESGNTVDKGEGVTDDIFRSLVLLTSVMMSDKIRKVLASRPAKNAGGQANPGSQVLVVSRNMAFTMPQPTGPNHIDVREENRYAVLVSSRNPNGG